MRSEQQHMLVPICMFRTDNVHGFFWVPFCDLFFSFCFFSFFVRCVFGGPFLSRSQLDFFVKCFFSRNRVRAKFSLFSSVGWYEAMSACLECYSLFIMKTTNKKSFLNFD